MGVETPDCVLISANLLWMFFVKAPTKIVILSGAPHRFIACHSPCGAESMDPDGADLTHAARSFLTTEAREQDPGTSFHASESSSIPRSVQGL
jgi:hypothetical protein